MKTSDEEYIMTSIKSEPDMEIIDDQTISENEPEKKLSNEHDENLKSIAKDEPMLALLDKNEAISIKNEPSSSCSKALTWPSLWKGGPRRSAFQPYKPSREVSVPRPASTTVMTNLQRGNSLAETNPVAADLSWFTLAARGDVTEEQLHEMVVQGKDLNCVDEEGLSGLMWAAYHGQIHLVEAMLREGRGTLDVDLAGMWGETALMLAATQGHLEIVRLLIAAGAEVDLQDHSGETALMCAVHSNHPHTVSELLSSGADLLVRNNDGCSAYDIAIDCQNIGSKAVLEKYMLSLLSMRVRTTPSPDLFESIADHHHPTERFG